MEVVSKDIYQSLIVTKAFKQIYKQLDPLKKEYIKLKDLSQTVKGIGGEEKRNALIKFFVAFIKQTNKTYISKVSFLTNAVNAYMQSKFDMHCLIAEDHKMQKSDQI